jgi:hypothetical protein
MPVPCNHLKPSLTFLGNTEAYPSGPLCRFANALLVKTSLILSKLLISGITFSLSKNVSQTFTIKLITPVIYGFP